VHACMCVCVYACMCACVYVYVCMCADAKVTHGLVDVGYKYLNLDAGVWLQNRSAEGR